MKDQIDLLLKDLTKLPQMSNVVVNVLKLVQDPGVSINDLALEISKDPSITASIIKLSNSAYYRASKPIRTVQESLMTLGIQTVKEIVLLSASKTVLNKDLKGYQLESEEMWMHSLIVAELSGKIAIMKKLPIAKDLAFTSGLLHDIGKVILTQFFPMKLFEIREELKNVNTTFTEIERKHFGYDHQEIGSKVLKIWNFPEELTEVVSYHHNPEKSEKYPVLVSIVHIANTIAIVSGIGIDIGGINQELSPFAMEQTGMTDKDLEVIFTHLPEIQKSLNELQTG
ncbi:MAG: HDOD domain-containing protein [Leptospiraceae bacterium]|nr:HDOD domain-containing protein [Leptospiraceae bacterium]MCP5511135.1 HDOD domain-containing protein [Leptospiraceae bacterium]